MKIKDMFAKKIDREIQGVIIVGQGEDANVSQELEEYVVTRELQKHFADFYSAYKKGIVGTTPKMGVWISGFFGSGKSHFLKILSYLLENRQVGDRKAMDYFVEDKKIVDPMVLADMKLAADTPTDVILFNIDSKSETNGKQNKDAIVNVFLKVFNQMQGFCGSIPHVADLERRLSEEGRYDEFKAAFEEEYGDPWEESRQDFDFIQDSVVDALVSMDFMSEAAARNWCEKAVEPYTISIEDFAKRVKSYIERKGNNHHVVFLVDEIGQYIGDDSKLMLNLQTVTEELGKECMGKAWVIVTSQQDIDSITKVKGNDFSKIQGRFDTRLSLSSANVDAVIKKRILEKTEPAAQTLRLLYEQKATIIKNLIVFNDTAEKKLYASAEDFAEVYPFVPYQFNLLSSVLTSIRTHGASGKHLSGGERSMLALFKESAVNVMNEEAGVIVPFHRFYDALENFLDHSHSGVIIRAYDNSYINPEKKDKDVFAINVLKTLFMIKYVLEIEANIDNITSLMIENIDDDRIELKGRVEEALKVLMRQMLVQKNGSIYVFLTDEEQEVNNEIEKENVETPVIINKVAEMIFEDIFPGKKYIYPTFNGRYAFSFNQSVDDRPYKANQSYDIGVRILTPWYDGSTDDATLRMMSGQGKEVLVVLPDDAEFLKEMQAYLKIEGFLRKNTSTQLPKYETIKQAKIVEMQDRNANAKLYLTEALKAFYKDYNMPTDRRVAKRMFRIVGENCKELPSVFAEVIGKRFGGDTDAYVDYLYDNSVFADERKALAAAAAGTDVSNDPAVLLNKSYTAKMRELAAAQLAGKRKFADGQRLYIAGLMRMQPNKAWASDANFTLRLTYGRVLPYDPADGIHYNYYTTLKGVMEKENPQNPTEFTVPARLKELYAAKDFGRYANERGELPVAFLADCDITGGNSGSPVMNAKGALIGLAFDGNWEAMSGDVAFEPELQRTIAVDVRYVLFVIDKFAGAGWLLDELQFE